MNLIFDDMSKSQLINEQIKKPSAVLFYADWCPHCVEVKPHWENISNKLSGKITMLSVRDDFIQHLENKNNYIINGFPNIIISKNGKTFKEFEGPRTPENIEKFIKNNLLNKKSRKKKKRKSRKKKSKKKI